jgi:23S rRNA pseudouridine1911/1915/1917 synthase
MKKLRIIYEDKYLIIVNKPTGEFTISRDNHYDNNLYDEVKTYVKKQNPKNKIFIVHRLDKDTSGLVLFAKNEKVKYDLQRNWQNVERKYYAVVSGKLNEKNGTLKDFLYETKGLDVVVTNIKKIGKLAITNFNVIENNNKYSLLDINIETGRRNQIRVQLANIGHPIIGDKKYGKVKYKRMMLEAYYLKFVHPVTKKVCYAELPLNNDFEKLF